MIDSKKQFLGLALTVVVLVSMVAASGAAAQSADEPSTFTVTQGEQCFVVEAYQPGYTVQEYSESRNLTDYTIDTHAAWVDENSRATNYDDDDGTQSPRERELGPYLAENYDGGPTIESVMDYRFYARNGGVVTDSHPEGHPYGQTPENAPYLDWDYRQESWQPATYGMTPWQENQGSGMWFYEGPDGVSLVMQHDQLGGGFDQGSHRMYYGDQHLDIVPGDSDSTGTAANGGAVSMQFENLPQGEWAYMDDYSPRENDYDPLRSGNQTYVHPHADSMDEGMKTNWSEGDGSQPLDAFDGGDFSVDWYWKGGQTDGGAYRGLENMQGPITIENQWNENAAYYADNQWRDIGENRMETWTLRDADGETHTLTMGEPITIEQGANANCDTTSPQEPANFSVSGLSVEPASSTQGESVTVSATVQNTGDQEDSRTVSLSVGDSALGSQQVTLAGGDSETVSFEVDTGDLPVGQHDVVIDAQDDSASGSLTVEAENSTTTDDGTTTDDDTTTETTTVDETTTSDDTTTETTTVEDTTTSTTDDGDDDADDDDNNAGSGGGGGGGGSAGPGVSQDGGLGIREMSVDSTEVASGDDVTATLELSNTDVISHDRNLKLKLDGTVIAEKRVFVDSGEEKTVQLTGTVEGNGTHELSVGGKSVELTVTGVSSDDASNVTTSNATTSEATTSDASTTAQPTQSTADDEAAQQDETATESASGGEGGSDSTTSGSVPGFGVVVALVALLAAALLATRRD